MLKITIIILVFLNILYSSEYEENLLKDKNQMILNSGNEFILTHLPSHYVGGKSPVLKLLIFSEHTTNVSIQGESFDKRITVSKNSVNEVDLSGEANLYNKKPNEQPNPNSNYKRKAVFIKSVEPITVYAITTTSTTSEGYYVLPIKSLGKEYLINTLEDKSDNINVWQPSQIAIFSSEDRTDCEIKYNQETKKIQLNEGDVYLLSSNNQNKALENVSITSDKPIGVITGSYCANIPYENSDCGFIQEMELPTNLWGKSYHLSPMNEDNSNCYISITCKNSDTEIFFNGEPIHSFTKSGTSKLFGPFENEYLFISSNKEISVTQYTFAGEGNYPMQVGLIPINEYLKEFIFYSPQTNNETHNYINLCYKSEYGMPPYDIKIGISDGEEFSFTPLRVKNPTIGVKYTDNGLNWCSVKIKLEKDKVYKIVSDSAIGAYIYNSRSENMHFGFPAYSTQFNTFNYYNLLTENIDFGEISINSDSTMKLNLLKNITDDKIAIKNITIQGSDKDQLSLSSNYDNFTLNSQADLEIEIKLDAKRIGVIDAHLQVEFADIDNIEIFPINSEIILNYDDYYKKLVNKVDFGIVFTKKPKQFVVDYIENTSTAPIEISNMNLKDNINGNFDYEIEKDNYTLPKGDKSEIKFIYQPNKFGKSNAFFEFELAEINRTDKIELSAEYRNPIEKMTDLIDFGYIPLNQSEEKNIVIFKNVSDQDFTLDKISIIGDNNNKFEIIGNTENILSKKSEELSINIKATGKEVGTDNSAVLLIESSEMDIELEIDLKMIVIGECEELTIVYPNGGENFNKGEVIPIRWCGISKEEEVNLMYSSNGGNTWGKIAEKVKGHIYNWIVPTDSLKTENLFKVEYDSGEGGNSSVLDTQKIFTSSYNNLYSFNISKSEKYLAATSLGGGAGKNDIIIIDLLNEKMKKINIPTSAGKNYLYNSVYFSDEDDNIIYVITYKNCYKINHNTNEIVQVYNTIKDLSLIYEMYLSQDQSKIYVQYESKMVAVFNEKDGSLNDFFEIPGRILDFSYDGKKILYNTDEGVNSKSYIYDTKTKKIDTTFKKILLSPYSRFINNSYDVLLWSSGINGQINTKYFDYKNQKTIEIPELDWDKEKYSNYKRKIYGSISKDSILYYESFLLKGKTNENYNYLHKTSILDLQKMTTKEISIDYGISTLEHYNISENRIVISSQSTVKVYNRSDLKQLNTFSLDAGFYKSKLELTNQNEIVYLEPIHDPDGVLTFLNEKYSINNKRIESQFITQGSYNYNRTFNTAKTKPELGIFIAGNINTYYQIDYTNMQLTDVISLPFLNYAVNINSFIFSSDDNYLAFNYTGYTDDNFKDPKNLLSIYDLDKKAIKYNFFKTEESNEGEGQYNDGSVEKKIDFSNDVKLIAFLYSPLKFSEDSCTICVYSLESEERIFYLKRLNNVRYIDLLKDGTFILINHTLYNTFTGKKILDLEGLSNSNGIASIAVSPNEIYVAGIVPKESLIKIWDTFTGKKVLEINYEGSPERASIIFSKDNSTLCLVGQLDESAKNRGVIYYTLDLQSGTYELISDQSNKYFTMNGTKTGVEVEQNINHTVYPNPSSELIRIKDYSGEFQIINTLGIEVKHGYCSKDLPIDISNLTTGVYLIKLKENTIKLMKR